MIKWLESALKISRKKRGKKIVIQNKISKLIIFGAEWVMWGFTIITLVYIWKGFFGTLVENRINVKILTLKYKATERHWINLYNSFWNFSGYNKHRPQVKHETNFQQASWLLTLCIYLILPLKKTNNDNDSSLHILFLCTSCYAKGFTCIIYNY